MNIGKNTPNRCAIFIPLSLFLKKRYLLKITKIRKEALKTKPL